MENETYEVLQETYIDENVDISSTVSSEAVEVIGTTLTSMYELQVYQFCSNLVLLGLIVAIIIALGVNSHEL